MSTAALPAGPHAKPSILEKLRDYVLPLAAISVIFVMLVPLPAACLDMLLALSMAASTIVFLSAVQIRRAVELSVFPTLLLLLTLFRLSLNIASSRRILLHGQEGTAAAGKDQYRRGAAGPEMPQSQLLPEYDRQARLIPALRQPIRWTPGQWPRAPEPVETWIASPAPRRGPSRSGWSCSLGQCPRLASIL